MKKHLTIRLEESVIIELKKYCIENKTTISGFIQGKIDEVLKDRWIEPVFINGWKEQKADIKVLKSECIRVGKTQDTNGTM